MYQMLVTVQKNGTPRRKPRNSGGSPMGVSAPPTLDTMKMKKMMWYAFSRPALSRMNGRISSIDAPVVPIKLLRSRRRRTAGSSWPRGVPAKVRLDQDAVPLATKSEPRSAINAKYSSARVLDGRMSPIRDDVVQPPHERAQPDRHLGVVVVPEVRVEQRPRRDHQEQAPRTGSRATSAAVRRGRHAWSSPCSCRRRRAPRPAISPSSCAARRRRSRPARPRDHRRAGSRASACGSDAAQRAEPSTSWGGRDAVLRRPPKQGEEQEARMRSAVVRESTEPRASCRP